MKDTYRHKGLRRKMIEKIKQRGISDEKVLEAMLRLPRHFFLDKAFEEWAYQDTAFPIGKKQTISQPYTVAYQTFLLEVTPRDKILEIGTGSGYQAALLGLLGAEVHTIERQGFLYENTKNLLARLGLDTISTYHKDGYMGLPLVAPFDKILLTAAAPELPHDLLQQLKINGFMIAPINNPDNPNIQTMTKITRISSDNFRVNPLEEFSFVPFVKGTTY